MILRNDDVCFATSAEHLRKFCALADKYGFQVIHAITPRGVCWASDGWLTARKNSEIYALGAGITIEQNTELVEFLRSRVGKDLFGIHGLFHTHRPRVEEWLQSRQILLDLGIEPTYIVPPFNEGNLKSHDFIVSGGEAANFEVTGVVGAPIAFLHSWRYDQKMWSAAYHKWWTWDALEQKLRHSQYPVMAPSESNTQKYNFLVPRISGKWLDIGCNTGRLLKTVPNGVGVDASEMPLRHGVFEASVERQQARAEELPFSDNSFDTVVLCSVLEQCLNWRDVLAEALRVTTAGGKVIGTVPHPGTRYGIIGYTQWVRSVIPPSEFAHTEPINNEHYYFEVTK